MNNQEGRTDNSQLFQVGNNQLTYQEAYSQIRRLSAAECFTISKLELEAILSQSGKGKP